MMSPEDYLDLIAFGYKDSRAAYGLFQLLRKHVGEKELDLWKPWLDEVIDGTLSSSYGYWK
jgi:hypothetical protein